MVFGAIQGVQITAIGDMARLFAPPSIISKGLRFLQIERLVLENYLPRYIGAVHDSEKPVIEVDEPLPEPAFTDSPKVTVIIIAPTLCRITQAIVQCEIG